MNTLYPVDGREVHVVGAYITEETVVWVDGNNDGTYTLFS